MSKADDDPIIPPEWVHLADLPRWVDFVHGVRSHAITGELVLAVRSKLETQHRIPCEPRDRTSSPSLPPGLVNEAWHGVRQVFVSDWEIAEADWKVGTVGGWKQGNGTRERLPIEVPWQQVDRFVRASLPWWKWEASSGSKTTTGGPRSGITSRGGAPPTYDWTAFIREALRAANLDGFETRADMAKHMLKWVAETWKYQPDPRTLQRKLAELYPADLPK
jgi:hypothetical protein